MGTSTLTASTVNTIYDQYQRQYEGGLVSTARNSRIASRLDTPMNWGLIAGNGLLGFAGLFLIAYFALGPLGVIGFDGVFHIHVPAVVFGVLGAIVCVLSCTLPAKLARMKSKEGKRNILRATVLAILISLGTAIYAGMVIFDLAENNGQDIETAQSARSDAISAVRGVRDSANATLNIAKDDYESASRNARVQQEGVRVASDAMSDWRASTLKNFGQGSAAANRRMGMADGVPTHPEHRALFDAIAAAGVERDKAIAERETARAAYEVALNDYKDAAKKFESRSEAIAAVGVARRINASENIGSVFGVSGDTVNMAFMTLFSIVLAFVPIMINYGDGKESEPAIQEIERDKEMEALKRKVAQMTMAGKQSLEDPTPAVATLAKTMDEYQGDEWAEDDRTEPVAYAPAPAMHPAAAQAERAPIAVTDEDRAKDEARETLRYGAVVRAALQDYGAGKLKNASIRHLSNYRIDENDTKAGPEGAKAIQKALVKDGAAEWVRFQNRTECRLMRAA